MEKMRKGKNNRKTIMKKWEMGKIDRKRIRKKRKRKGKCEKMKGEKGRLGKEIMRRMGNGKMRESE